MNFNKEIPIYMRHYYNQKMGIKNDNEPKKTEKELKEERFKDKINDIKKNDIIKKPISPKETSINEYIELLKDEGNRYKYIELLEALKDE